MCSSYRIFHYNNKASQDDKDKSIKETFSQLTDDFNNNSTLARIHVNAIIPRQ